MSKLLPNLEDYEISAAALQALLEDPASVRLIDCREEDEFQHCRIEGAELIPLSRFGELAPALLGDSSKPIVVY